MVVGNREVQAFTRDLSARSVYFLVASSDTPDMGQDLEFVIEIPPAISFSELCRIQGKGRTVRVESASRNETGVVAEILSYEIVKNKQNNVVSNFAMRNEHHMY